MVGWMIADRMGCGVYRCLVPGLGLKERGVTDSEFLDRRHLAPEGPDGALTEGQIDAQLSGLSHVVVQRPGHPVMLAWMRAATQRGLPVLVELDDDIWHLAKHNPAHGYWRQEGRETLVRAIQQADHVLVSTPALADVVAQHGRRRRQDITVAYNHLHDAVWGAQLLDTLTPKPDPLGRTVLGWQGSPTHSTDFTVALPALVTILREYPRVVLRFFGSVPESIRGVIDPTRFEWAKGVPFEEYPLSLKAMGFDIMLAPLTPSKFNESKSNLRWLEASALGLPTVASDVGPYRAIVHGETGLLARTTDEWIAALRRLIEDAEERRAMGARAHQHVWSTWGPDRVQAWVNVVGVGPWQTASAAS